MPVQPELIAIAALCILIAILVIAWR